MKMQMTKATTIKELQRLAEEIKVESFHWQRLRKLIPYELMPVIENCPPAHAEFSRRAHYYERLKSDATYRAIYERMLAAMQQIYPYIERKKLSLSKFYFLPKEQIVPTKKPLLDKEGYPIRDPDSVPIKIFCAALPHRERWCDLGEGFGQSFAEDSVFCRWRGTLQQFDNVAIFLQGVMYEQALKTRGMEFVPEIKVCLRELSDVLQKPWERDHIRAFETVAAYVRRHAGDDETIAPTIRKDMEMDFQLAQKSVPIVCRDLITFLEGSEEKPSEKQTENLSRNIVAEIPARRTTVVNGIKVDFEIQKVSHPEFGSFVFESGKIPWRIVRVCAEEKSDGVGRASLESLRITKSDISKKLKLVNQHFRKPIVHYKDEWVYLDPYFLE